ncbi:hypothetical protein V8Z69_14785 [Microbacterium aurugineum]|uniref:hypothetical protein n=1 Tax=Microbacterium TaxID=33882 RepID=UPI001E309F38|nr:hypothetical protein [Microbacterium sp. KKR3/1]MCE0509598.1 hypothetical protein [Microbacterium sp. KKR3/1]
MWSTTVTGLRPRTVIRWLSLAVWPVNLVFGTSMAAASAAAIVFDQPGILGALLVVGMHYVCGLCASFAIHELGHAILLSWSPGVTTITLERTLLRISVRPHGSIRGRDAFLTAVAGPSLCVVIGMLLWLAVPHVQLQGWFLFHALFLTPAFNDGRIMLIGARSWNRV